MINRFVHYTKSAQAEYQPILLGVSTVDESVDGVSKVIGHSFDMEKLPKEQQEDVNWGIGYLLSNPEEEAITLQGTETRRQNV